MQAKLYWGVLCLIILIVCTWNCLLTLFCYLFFLFCFYVFFYWHLSLYLWLFIGKSAKEILVLALFIIGSFTLISCLFQVLDWRVFFLIFSRPLWKFLIHIGNSTVFHLILCWLCWHSTLGDRKEKIFLIFTFAISGFLFIKLFELLASVLLLIFRHRVYRSKRLI